MTKNIKILRNRNLATLTGLVTGQDWVTLSPAFGREYGKTQALRNMAVTDFLDDHEFILGFSSMDVSRRAADPTVNRAHILRIMRKNKIAKTIVVILTHNRSEVVRFDLECTFGRRS